MKKSFIFIVIIFLIPVLSQRVLGQKLKKKLTQAETQWVENTLKSMSTEQKVGQLLAPAIGPGNGEANTKILKQVTEWMQKYHIGHVYVASSKMDPYKTALLINDFQRNSNLPLLIHSDLECGTGTKFDGATILTWPMGVAQTRSTKLAYKTAEITAKESRAIGIHLINSPVLDVNINSDNPVINVRSFGDDANLVSKMGEVYVKSFNDHGLIGAAEHFPGHGDVNVDTHSKMPSINVSRERLDSIEFLPYSKVIPNGLMAIMTAHISIPVVDPTPNLPATLSKPILTDVLRGDLGFDGLIITDAFDMGGILEFGSFEESAVKAVLAGNDVVLLWTDPRFETVFPHMLKAVQDGRISQSHLDASVRRCLSLKARLGLHMQKLVDIDAIRLKVGIPEHQKMASEIYERSIVLVKNEGDVLPLSKYSGDIAVLSINDDKDHKDIGETFINELKKRTPVFTEFYADPETSQDELNKTFQTVQNADVIVVGLFARIMARRGSAGLIHDHIIEFLQKLSTGDTPVVVVSFGSPYLLSQIPKVDSYLISSEPTWEFYGYKKHRPGQLAAAKAVFGEIDINGKLAVAIPELYPFGYGINLKSVMDQ